MRNTNLLLAIVVAGMLAVRAVGAGDPLPLGAALNGRALRGQWPQFRGDGRLTGRSDLKGNIHSPAILWKHSVGARETLLVVTLNRPGQRTVALPDADLGADPAVDLQGQWGLVGQYGSTSSKVGRFLAERDGLQRIEFDSQFRVNTGGGNVANHGRLQVQTDGAWETVWTSPSIPDLFCPNPIVGDFDGDDHLEVAVMPLRDLWVLDMASGREEHRCGFAPPGTPSGRGYGWVGAFDLDGGGKQEFVILADFANHMEVLGWKQGELTRLWYHTIENSITRKATTLHPGTDPVQDIDGDGKPEIVVSIFNLSGDERWHVVGYRAMTGEVMFDLPGQYLAGMADVDGDAAAELFCSATGTSLTSFPSELSVIGFSDGKQTVRWRRQQSAFQTYELPGFPLHVNSCAATGRKTLLAGAVSGDRRAVFFTRQTPDVGTGLTEVTAWAADPESAIRSMGQISGPRLEMLAVHPSGQLAQVLAKAERIAGQQADVLCDGTDAKPLFSQSVSVPTTTATVGRLRPDDEPTVVVQGAAETIHAFRPPTAGSPAQILWRADGRGLLDGPILADLRGDGELAVVAISRHGRNGCARVVAYDPAGAEIWHRDMERFPGPPPPWNVAGFTFGFVGRFSSADRQDVMVSLRRGTMHSDETFLLDGRTGKVIWHRDKGGSDWGCGGNLVAVYDHDADGRDDALTFYPVVAYVMRGTDGRILLDRSALDIFSCPAYYAKPVVADFLGNGQLQWLYTGTAYVQGLLDAQGQIIWRTEPAAGTPAILPGLGDADADGKLDLFSPGHRLEPGSHQQAFHCIDAATGKVKWKLPLPGGCYYGNNAAYPNAPRATATADLDGDGRDECVFDVGNTLYAVGAAADGRSGEVLWTLTLPGQFGPPAIADVDGDGHVEIVLVCANGYVYGIGPAGVQAGEVHSDGGR